ncbi:MAG: DUF1932 domain-containing protein [Acidimicrobiales bacterium]
MASPHKRNIAILHPGAMGSSVAAAATSAGHTVRWCSAGRSEASSKRAQQAGLVAVTSLPDLLAASDMVISVCPPASAVDVAAEVAAAAAQCGFSGLYLDANAISEATALAVAQAFETAELEGGVEVVDGGIVGPPAWTQGSTRLFVSGRRSGEVASLFDGTLLETVDLGDRYGAASALKMAYAAWTKGSSALLAAVGAYAAAAGVDQALEAEWARSQPGLGDRLASTLHSVGPKAWRFVGEMHEIADSFASVGQPSGYHRAAAETYAAMAAERARSGPGGEMSHG